MTSAADVETSTAAPWYLRLGAWLGIGTGPGALMTGGGVAQTTARAWLWIALVAGAAVLTGLAAAHARAGQRRGAPTVGLAAGALGSRGGPRLVAVLIAVGTSLWTGFYIGVGAAAVGYLTGVPTLLAALALAAGLYAVHQAGFERWNLVVGLTGVAALAVGVLVLVGVPASDSVPSPVAGGWPTALVGAGSVVAYAAVFSVRVPDFTWDAPRARAALWGGAALFVTLVAFLGIGAEVFVRTGSWELADLVNRTRLPAAGGALLVLSVIAPSVSGLHSAALALQQLLGWSRARGAGVSVAIGAVLGATRFDLQLIPFLDVLGAVVPPVLPVVLLRTERHADHATWLAWGGGAAVSVAMLALAVPSHILAGILVSALVMAAGWLRDRARTDRPRGVSA